MKTFVMSMDHEKPPTTIKYTLWPPGVKLCRYKYKSMSVILYLCFIYILFSVGKLAVATPPQPFSQSQPTPSVITRMLQSQPLQNQPFTTAANAMNQKYFGSMDQPRGPPPQFSSINPRGRVPSPYRQNIPAGPYPPPRPGLNPGSPHRLRSPGPQNLQMFHSPHHLDPSPSGGGHIISNTPNRDRQSPLESKGGPTPPPTYNRPMTRFPAGNDPPLESKGAPTPPPAYNRPTTRFPAEDSTPGPSGPNVRAHHMPFQAANPLQSSSPPRGGTPGGSGGNFSPYNPPPATNYHYGAYPPPPTLAAGDDALPATAYQTTSYPEPYNNPENVTQSSEGSNSKPFDEEGSGEFGGLVSYFSSQREDDIDT